MSKHTVTNETEGPKVLNSVPIILLGAGESTAEPVEMTDDELKVAKATGWFKFGTPKA